MEPRARRDRNRRIGRAGPRRGWNAAIAGASRNALHHRRRSSAGGQRLGNRFPSSQILMRKCDVGVEEQISKLVEEVLHRFGKLDILVNLVGGFWGGKPVAETTLAEWQSMFDLNLKPTFLCCRAAVPAMAAQRLRADRVGQLAQRLTAR
jgi:NAD(P)-dependent dehydrogenase (short-subunit alcohol dehydrogenase family)